MEGLYEVRRCNGLQWHNTPTKLHEDCILFVVLKQKTFV
jgi:hypothetical protein